MCKCPNMKYVIATAFLLPLIELLLSRSHSLDSDMGKAKAEPQHLNDVACPAAPPPPASGRGWRSAGRE